MRVLLTGGSGQLGREVLKRAPSSMDLVAPPREVLDLSDASAVEAYARDLAPTHILHAAGWTAVDAAESQEEAARAVNAGSTAALAKVARQLGAAMLYVSTDFVFGEEHDQPIDPDYPTDPLSVYGLTKFEGECELQERLGEQCIIVRTSCVYASHGRNFVRTMLQLMNERPELRIVADQFGSPTWAGKLAGVCLDLLQARAWGTWHMSDAGVTSWHGFATAIYEQGRALGLIENEVTLKAIGSADYPTPAVRPSYSALDSSATWERLGRAPMPWRQALYQVMLELKAATPSQQDLT